MLHFHSVRYVSFFKVMEWLGIPCSHSMLESWNYFDFPFRDKGEEMILESSRAVRNQICNVFLSEQDSNIIFPIYEQFKLIPKGKVVDPGDDTVYDYKFNVKLPDGSLVGPYDFIAVAGELVRQFKEKWDRAVPQDVMVYFDF